MALTFNDRKQLEEFLADKPAQWSHLIAARSALRVLPLALVVMSLEHGFPMVRACFISWATGRYPAHEMTSAARSADSALSSRSAGSAARSALSAGSALSADSAICALSAISTLSALSAARSAGSAARSATLSAGSAAGSAARSARSARSAGSAALSAARSALSTTWRAVSADANWLMARTDKPSFADVTLAPLWLGDIPSWIAKPWQSFREKAGKASGYDPWINWYQALLTGNGPSADYFGEALTLQIARQPDTWWKRPAVEVNADIARWLAERAVNDQADFHNKIDEAQKHLIQHPAAAAFGWTDEGLSAEPPAPIPTGSLVQDFLDAAKQKAQALRDRLATTDAAHRVRTSLDGVIAILPEQAADLRPGLLRSRARSLHADASAYAGQFQDGELAVDAVAMIIDLSGELRDLEGCFPELRAIEQEIVALNLKPKDVPAVQQHLSDINNIVAASPVVADSAKSVMAAGTETMKAEATPEIVEVRTAEQALTSRNLVNAALRGCLEQVLSRLPGTTGRFYDETEKAGLNLVRPTASVGASVLVASLVHPVVGLALFALAEFDRLPGIIKFIQEASKLISPKDDDKP